MTNNDADVGIIALGLYWLQYAAECALQICPVFDNLACKIFHRATVKTFAVSQDIERLIFLGKVNGYFVFTPASRAILSDVGVPAWQQFGIDSRKKSPRWADSKNF